MYETYFAYFAWFALTWLACLILGMYVASEKGRGLGEGFFLALLFGPFGVVVEGLLPNFPERRPLPALRDSTEVEPELEPAPSIESPRSSRLGKPLRELRE